MRPLPTGTDVSGPFIRSTDVARLVMHRRTGAALALCRCLHAPVLSVHVTPASNLDSTVLSSFSLLV